MLIWNFSRKFIRSAQKKEKSFPMRLEKSPWKGLFRFTHHGESDKNLS
ncbi:hypothetical protein B4064_2718 [Caldibacillus thermoamylovorans]|nr:hypothetical protein B4064_2718 [Caldibacillus thermoamylovorans]